MMVSVEADALPMPRARWPAARPMLTIRYQRDVVRASSARLRTICTPRWRAVSKPIVAADGDEAVDLEGAEHAEHIVHRLGRSGRVGARRAEDGAAAESDFLEFL